MPPSAAFLQKEVLPKDFKNFFQRLSHPFQRLPTKIMITDSTIIIRIMIEDTVFIVLLKHHSQTSQPNIAAKHRSQASMLRLCTKQRELYISRNEWHIDFWVIMMFPKYWWIEATSHIVDFKTQKLSTFQIVTPPKSHSGTHILEYHFS